MNVSYEKREMKREEKKIKIYYLFFIDVSTKENNNYLTINKVTFDPLTPNSNKNSSFVDSSVSHRSEIDKILHTTLKQNNLNVKDIFKISKLENQGYYEINLFDVYDNIIELFTDKIGLIGEDEFSKSILQIKEVKSTLSMTNTEFLINVNYEKREMKREDKKIKIYYLFFIDVSLKENNNNLLSINQESTLIVDKASKKNEVSILESKIEKTEIDKIIHTSMKQKILYSNKLSYYILKKFFKIKIVIPKRQIMDEEMNELLDD